MDSIAKANPAVLPLTAVKKISVKASEISSHQDELRARNVAGMLYWVSELFGGDRKFFNPRRKASLDGPSFSVHFEYVVDQECLGRVDERAKERLHFWTIHCERKSHERDKNAITLKTPAQMQQR
jgi:hypothetical protein